MTAPDGRGLDAPGARPRVRDGAERSLLLVIVSFIVAVVGTRWFLQATGYPQVGGGELHVAHMLWGGLALVIAALLGLVVSAAWVPTVMAILTGAGTGLFIDEVGKFITASNDYFYPLAAPLIYGLVLALALVFLLVRHRDGGTPAVRRPARVSAWEEAHLSRRRYRRMLVALLLLVGLGWLASLALFLALDSATLSSLIDTVARVPGDRVERPTEPVFYYPRGRRPRGRWPAPGDGCRRPGAGPREPGRRLGHGGTRHRPHGRRAREPLRGAGLGHRLHDRPRRAPVRGPPLPEPVPGVRLARTVGGPDGAEHAMTDAAPARGQQIVMLLAASGRRLTVHIGEVLDSADLATNVPVLVLCEIALRGPLRPRDLLEPTHLTSGALTKHLDHLEQLELIERSFGTVKGDRRGSLVSLTAKGQRAADAIGQAVEERLDEITSLRDELDRLLGD